MVTAHARSCFPFRHKFHRILRIHRIRFAVECVGSASSRFLIGSEIGGIGRAKILQTFAVTFFFQILESGDDVVLHPPRIELGAVVGLQRGGFIVGYAGLVAADAAQGVGGRGQIRRFRPVAAVVIRHAQLRAELAGGRNFVFIYQRGHAGIAFIESTIIAPEIMHWQFLPGRTGGGIERYAVIGVIVGA